MSETRLPVDVHAPPGAAKLDNVPRALFDERVGPRQKYEQLVVGRSGLGPLVRYEIITSVARGFPGAAGLWLRARLYPYLLGACGRNVFFGVGVTLRHPHKIRIGDNVVIDDGAVLDAKGNANRGISIGSNVFIGRQSSLSTKDGAIDVEDGVNIGVLCSVFSASTVRIGRDTLLAAYAYIVGGGHAFERVDVAVSEQERPSLGIDIGPGSWIGAGVVVLDGVTIGRSAVVGANAVVTRDLPDCAVASGVPATVRRVRADAAGEP